MHRRVIPFAVGLFTLIVLACNLSATPEVERHATPTLSPVPMRTETASTTIGVTPSPTDLPPPTPAPSLTEPPAPTSLNVPLQVYNSHDGPRMGEPVTAGVPLPRDLNLANPTRLRLVDAKGHAVPAQFTPLARWGSDPDDPNAPIRWVLADFQTAVDPYAVATYFLQEGGPGPTPERGLAVTESADGLTIDTGIGQWYISKTDGGLMGPGLSAPLFGRALSGPAFEGPAYETGGPVTVRVALAGPLRVSVHVRGAYQDASGNPLVDYTSRYWFYAGHQTVRLFHTIENNALCRLVEYEQMDCYDIGSAGSVEVSELSLVVPTGLGDALTYQAGGETQVVNGELTANLSLYQDSSGTDHWDHYPTKLDWEGNPLDTRPRMQSYVSFRGYRATLGETVVDSGDHATGWLSVAGENGAWTVGVRDFWQNFPKTLRARLGGTLEIGLFPDEFGPPDYAFTLRPGEHKTHEVYLSYSSSGTTIAGVESLFAAAPPAWYVQSGAFDLTALPQPTNWPDYEDYVQHQLDTAPTYEEWMDWYPNLPAAIRGADFYGLYDYGDWPIDYEGYGVAPLNCKYDNDYGMWLQWARTGDGRWFRLSEAADRHVADIDILHNLHTPRHWGDGIAFGHSWHDEDGFTNPHRNGGGNHPDTAFGMKGLLLAYYLTGYEKAYQSALELADCIEYRLHHDRHLCSYFSDCSGEGYGLGDSDGLYEAGARPAANALSIAVAAYRATGDPRYLAVADALVDWAQAGNQPYIHEPEADDERMMRPWMLNMYLRALADYLEMREEYGLADALSARDSFLAYAHWLRTDAWIDLEAVETGPRAAYPYEWWFDGRKGDPNDEWSVGNNVPSVNNWLLLGADAMAYAYRISGDGDYLERAATLFRTGTRDPWFEGDLNTFSSTKETVNSITFGHLFLHEWAKAR